MKRGSGWVTALLAAGALASMVAGPADARRGGSFGSRGSRTYSSPRSTGLSPYSTPGVSRSMTPRDAGSAYGSQYGSRFGQPANVGRARSRFGFGGGLLAGVVAGGLFGALLGHGGGMGYGGGGGGGLLTILIQLAIVGGVIWFALRLFRGRGAATAPAYDRAPVAPASFGGPFAAQPSYAQPTYAPASAPGDDIALGQDDQQAFERLLFELQDAFGREDYARLRQITTPEIMSYLAEELSDNATHGRRNEVSNTRLLDAEVSEAWREGDVDYATIAMRYESIDVTRDRATGAVVAGDPSRPSTTTELWTFVRRAGAPWQVSAIQEA